MLSSSSLPPDESPASSLQPPFRRVSSQPGPLPALSPPGPLQLTATPASPAALSYRRQVSSLAGHLPRLSSCPASQDPATPRLPGPLQPPATSASLAAFSHAARTHRAKPSFKSFSPSASQSVISEEASLLLHYAQSSRITSLVHSRFHVSFSLIGLIVSSRSSIPKFYHLFRPS